MLTEIQRQQVIDDLMHLQADEILFKVYKKHLHHWSKMCGNCGQRFGRHHGNPSYCHNGSRFVENKEMTCLFRAMLRVVL